MAMSTGGGGAGEPMMEINTTPLIDVMLVLLIMIIMTIPVQTHAVKVDLPQQAPPQNQLVEPEKNKLYIGQDGTVTWNGIPVDDVTLQQYLEQTTQKNPEPELHFQPDPQAQYDKVDHILAIVKRANVTKLGFVGNEQYRNDF
jgi:biopolymer transport protein ExbD